MAAKKVTVKPVEKTTDAAVKPAVPKTEETKAEVKKTEAPAAAVKAETKKEEVKKAAPAKKAEAKKTDAKKAAPGRKAAAKKAELKSEVHIQFAEKSYSQEELIKIAKDVWKYDLKQKVSELTSVELYVKPEESKVYYVMNKDVKGNFLI
ncbi:MAG: DUF6465 family protein [Acetatifactor sp.]